MSAPAKYTDAYFSSPTWLDIHFQAKREHHEATARLLDINPRDTVLELGCGSGAWSSLLLPMVGPLGRLVCADPSPENIAFAKTTSTAPNLEYVVASAETLPDNLGLFDVVHVANVVGYFSDRNGTFRQLRSRLKAGGRLIVRQYDEGGFLLHPVREELLSAAKKAVAGVTHRDTALEPDMYAGRALRQTLLDCGFVKVDRRPLICAFDAPYREPIQHYLEMTCEWVDECIAERAPEHLTDWRAEVLETLRKGRIEMFAELEFLYHATG